MKCNFEKIELSEDQEIWLREVYNCFKNYEDVYYRILKARLINDIPKDFNPDTISDKLLTGRRYITPIGIEQLDPKSGYLKAMDQIVEALYQYLQEKPKSHEISSNDLKEFHDLDDKLACWLLEYVYRIFSFFPSMSSNNKEKEVTVSMGKNTFDLIWNFPGICEYTKDYYWKRENENNKNFNEEYRNLRKRPQESEVRLQPIFHSKVTRIDPKLCFVIMPFEEDWSDRVYNRLIKDYIEPLGLQCLRADNLHGPIVMDDIWVKINQSAFVIADVTGKNPNVMYELGLVHTVGKPCILITQEFDEIPFDTNYLRHYGYEDVEGGFDELGEKFRNIIEEIYNNSYGGIEFPD